ncbi:MAG: NHLP leader peptide family RiPP precursor [Verrucomicrobiota bacterium]
MKETNIINQIIARCWTDDAFKQSLKNEPRKVLAEFGVHFDEPVTIKVIEDEPNVKTMVIPPKPDEGELNEILEGRKSANGGFNGCMCG